MFTYTVARSHALSTRRRPHRRTAFLAALVLCVSAGLGTSSVATEPSTLPPGSLLVADGAGQVMVISSDGSTSVLPLDGLVSPAGVSVNGSGDVVVSDKAADRVVKLSADGTQSDIGSGLDNPLEVAIDDTGTVYIADGRNARVLEVSSDGTQTTIGDDGRFEPHGLAADAGGNVFVSDPESSEVWKISPAGAESLPTDLLFKPMGLAVDGLGNLFIADEFNDRVVRLAPDGTQTTVVAAISRPTAVTVDPAENVYVVTFDGDVVKVASDGARTVVASGLGNQLGSVAFVSGALRAQTITFTATAPPTAVEGDTFTVEATGGESGNPVVFSGDPAFEDVCEVESDGSVLATGTGQCLIFASQAGNEQFAAAQGQMVAAIRLPQRLQVGIGNPQQTVGEVDQIAVEVGRDTGAFPKFAVTDQDPIPGANPSTPVCRVDGAGNLFNLSPGECEVTVTVPSSANYAVAVQTLRVAVAKQAALALEKTPLTSAVGDTVNLGVKNPYNLPARMSSGTPAICTVEENGQAVSFLSQGVCEVELSLDEAPGYLPVQTTHTIDVREPQVVKFTSAIPPSRARTPGTQYKVQAAGGDSGKPVTFAVGTGGAPGACSVSKTGDVKLLKTGSCPVIAYQGSANGFLSGEASQRVIVK